MSNDWNVWSKHVILELERLDKCVSAIKADISDLKVRLASVNKDLDDLPQLLSDLKKQITKLQEKLSDDAIEIGKLQVKSGVWGFVGGALPVLIMVLIKWLLTK